MPLKCKTGPEIVYQRLRINYLEVPETKHGS